jgi:hypothetical protein
LIKNPSSLHEYKSKPNLKKKHVLAQRIPSPETNVLANEILSEETIPQENTPKKQESNDTGGMVSSSTSLFSSLGSQKSLSKNKNIPISSRMGSMSLSNNLLSSGANGELLNPLLMAPTLLLSDTNSQTFVDSS